MEKKKPKFSNYNLVDFYADWPIVIDRNGRVKPRFFF